MLSLRDNRALRQFDNARAIACADNYDDVTQDETVMGYDDGAEWMVDFLSRMDEDDDLISADLAWVNTAADADGVTLDDDAIEGALYVLANL